MTDSTANNESFSSDNRSIPIVQLSIALILVWTVTLAFFYNWLRHNEEEQMFQNAKIVARSAFTKDVIYRKWNTEHGGVYAPITEITQPNPYLPENIEKEAVTSSGVELTLINPAYMTRQVHELAEKEFGIKGHITSLNPVRPANAADEWETAALEKFEKGEKEVIGISQIDGEEYLRLMGAFTVEKGCLKCHEQQGYKVGDIRGGISVSVPMAPYRASGQATFSTLWVSGLSMWSFGVVVISLGSFFLTRRVKEKETYEQQILDSNRKHKELSDQLNVANSEMVFFSEQVTNNLRTNLRHIDGFYKIMVSKLEDVDPGVYQREQNVINNAMGNIRSMVLKLDHFYKSSNKALNKVTFDLSQAFGDIVKKTVDSEGLDTVQWQIQPDIRCKCDPTLIRIALAQLIANASKFTSLETEPQISFGMKVQDDHRVYFVSDNGPGFSTESSDNLFAPYVKIADSYEEGVGVGLAVVEKVVTRHGGKVWAESESGQGATFYFTLGEDE